MGDTKAMPLRRIEELKTELKISDAVFEGIKAANRWKSGKQVSEAEFTAAASAFLAAPVDGREPDKEAKG